MKAKAEENMKQRDSKEHVQENSKFCILYKQAF